MTSPARPRIMLLIPTLDRSGAEKQLTLLACGLPREEFDVRVVTLTRNGPYAADLEAAGIPVTSLHKRFKLDPFAWWRLRNLLRQQPPDLLHTWLFAANAYGRAVAGRKPKFPIVVSERCVDSWKSGWQLRLDRQFISRTSRLVANSQSVAEFYLRLGYPPEKIAVVSNGIHLPPPAPVDKIRDLAELGLPSNAYVMFYAGRLARQKRVDDLIWAFELVRLLHGDVVLIIAGDGPERPQLEEFVRSIHIENRVRFLGRRHDVPRWLGICDVFLLASDFEGQSNSVLEAMSHGKPCVVSDIPPNRELIENGQTGLLAKVGDRPAIQRAVLRLIKEPGLSARLGDAARERIAQHFSVAAMVSGYAAIYRELLKPVSK